MWRDIIKGWVSDDKLLNVVELVEIFVRYGVVPPSLCGNDTLYAICLTQMMVLYLEGVSVPQRPPTSAPLGGSSFCYHANCHTMMREDLYNKQAMKALKVETGVDLDHYKLLTCRGGGGTDMFFGYV
jgi:hypothetical protein